MARSGGNKIEREQGGRMVEEEIGKRENVRKRGSGRMSERERKNGNKASKRKRSISRIKKWSAEENKRQEETKILTRVHVCLD